MATLKPLRASGWKPQQSSRAAAQAAPNSRRQRVTPLHPPPPPPPRTPQDADRLSQQRQQRDDFDSELMDDAELDDVLDEVDPQQAAEAAYRRAAAGM